MTPQQSRTALNSIVGFSKLLASGEVGSLSIEQKRHLDIIYKASYSLMGDLESLKPKVIVFWSAEIGALNVVEDSFKGLMRTQSGKTACALSADLLTPDSLQDLREQHHYILATVPPMITEQNAYLFDEAAEIVIVSSSPEQETANQVSFLSKLSHMASKTSFYINNQPNSANERSKLVRKLCDKKVGVALSSGMAPGIAHVGVMKVLLQEKIPIDFLAGTSGGALYGALFAAGLDPLDIEKVIVNAFQKHMFASLSFSFNMMGLLSCRKLIRKILQEPLSKKDVSLAEMKIPFLIAATDLQSGQQKIFNTGSLMDAVSASISIPTMFSPFKKGGRFYADGVVTTPIPVLPLKERGADITIAVHVSEITRYDRPKPNMLDVFMRARSISSEELARYQLKGADIVIKPETNHIGYMAYNRAEELIRLGEEAAWKAMPEIKAKLNMN